MDAYIEVVGSASYLERITEHRMDISLTVRAAQGDTASKEASALRNDCIRTLKDAGILHEELKEGGRENWRPWFWKKKPGQEISHKILITCSDIKRLYHALDALEPLFQNPRFTLAVSLRSPLFTASKEEKNNARIQAIRDAREQAGLLAAEADVTLKGILQIEQQGAKVERTGMFGDEDWRAAGFALARECGGEEENVFEHLDEASRKHTVHYQVRFAIA